MYNTNSLRSGYSRRKRLFSLKNRSRSASIADMEDFPHSLATWSSQYSLHSTRSLRFSDGYQDATYLNVGQNLPPLVNQAKEIGTMARHHGLARPLRPPREDEGTERNI
ncbi:hypothetical protein TSMEX_011638 [Taenia solium]|eukprot:TsM_001122400 transcript=TsM_001122400 gene=TsM_001122400